jgi:hypothetical protein
MDIVGQVADETSCGKQVRALVQQNKFVLAFCFFNKLVYGEHPNCYPDLWLEIADCTDDIDSFQSLVMASSSHATTVPAGVSVVSDSESGSEYIPELLDDSESESDVQFRWAGETGGAKSSVPAPSVQSRGKGRGVARPTPAADFIEVFAGSANLSRSVARTGMRVAAWDLRHGPQFDMSQISAVRDLTDIAIASGARYVHFAPPCNTYSRARWPRIRFVS